MSSRIYTHASLGSNEITKRPTNGGLGSTRAHSVSDAYWYTSTQEHTSTCVLVSIVRPISYVLLCTLNFSFPINDKPNLAFGFLLRRRLHQPADGVEDRGDLLVVRSDLMF